MSCAVFWTYDRQRQFAAQDTDNLFLLPIILQIGHYDLELWLCGNGDFSDVCMASMQKQTTQKRSAFVADLVVTRCSDGTTGQADLRQ